MSRLSIAVKTFRSRKNIVLRACTPSLPHSVVSRRYYTLTHKSRKRTEQLRNLATLSFPNFKQPIRHLDHGIKLVTAQGGRLLALSEAICEAPPLDLIFLRDSCTCPRCINTFSGQKQFETADIPLDIDVSEAYRDESSNVCIKWVNDIPGFEGHVTSVPSKFWLTNSTRLMRYQTAYEETLSEPWTRRILCSREHSIRFDYAEYMRSREVLHSALKTLSRDGLLFIDNVPNEQYSVIGMSNRIGPIQNTFYGETWDVRAQPSAKNVAYTAAFLGFHMDLLYMKDPPYLQFLHCIKQSTEGGESLFSDALNAVYHIQSSRPDLAPLMWQFPVTYRYKNGGKYYQYTRSMLEGPAMLDADNIYRNWNENSKSGCMESISSSRAALLWGRHFDAINWSPPFQGPFIWDVGQHQAQSSKSSLRGFVQMSRLFRQVLEEPANVFETKMREGTCVIFDNRRIVHARKAFSAKGGERWLKGSYVDSNSFKSRLRALNAGLNDDLPIALEP